MTNHSKSRKQFASKGGKARAASLTPEKRSEIARKAANKRWNKMADEQPVTPDRTCSFCTRTSGWNKIITSAATQVSICDTCIITMLEQWLLEPKATDRKEVEKLRADNKALLAMIANIGAVMNGSKIQT